MKELAIELWGFFKERKKFWLLPILFFLVLIGGLIVLTEGSAVAPFISPLGFSQKEYSATIASEITNPKLTPAITPRRGFSGNRMRSRRIRQTQINGRRNWNDLQKP